MEDIAQKGGKFIGPSHANNGIPIIVKETNQQLEVEGNEPLITKEALVSTTIHQYTGTNFEILNKINQSVGAKGLNQKATEIHVGDVVICKKTLQDKTVKTLKGTHKQIISAINTAAGCNIIEPGATITDKKGTKQYKYGGEIKSNKFKKWFGNSKVIDEKGKPLVVYHGTNADFLIFNTEDIENIGNTVYRNKKSVFFTSNPYYASTYTTEKTFKEQKKYAEGGNIIPVYLRIINPLEVNANGNNFRNIYFGEKLGSKLYLKFKKLGFTYLDEDVFLKGVQTTNDVSFLSRELGYDGIIIKNVKDLGSKKKGKQTTTVYAVHNPTQIKSSIGNKGTFDINNPDITLKYGGEIKNLVADLYKDHQQAIYSINEINETFNLDNNQNFTENLLIVLKNELKHHFTEEEIEFFPTIKTTENSQIINNLINEHKWFIIKIKELIKLPTKNLIKAFCNKLINHINKEEKLMGKIMPNPYKNNVMENKDTKRDEYLELERELNGIGYNYPSEKRQDEIYKQMEEIEKSNPEFFKNGGEINFEEEYEKVKDIENNIQLGMSESGRTFGTVEEIAPKYLLIKDFLITKLKAKGFKDIMVQTAKSGTIYIYPLGSGSDYYGIRIADHNGRGGIYSTHFDIRNLENAKSIIDKIPSFKDYDDDMNKQKEMSDKRWQLTKDFELELKNNGLAFNELQRTYLSLPEIEKKGYTNIRQIELDLSNNQMAYKYQYTYPFTGYYNRPDYDYLQWFRQNGNFKTKLKNGGEIMKNYNADDYFTINDTTEFMFTNKNNATKLANKYDATIIEEQGNFYVPITTKKLAKGGEITIDIKLFEPQNTTQLTKSLDNIKTLAEEYTDKKEKDVFYGSGITMIQNNFFNDVVSKHPTVLLKMLQIVKEKLKPSERFNVNNIFDYDYQSKYTELFFKNLKTPLWKLIPQEFKKVNNIKHLSFKPTPTNENLGKIMNLFTSEDMLRPIMMGVYFDKEQSNIVATNAHIMLVLHQKINLPESKTYLMGKNLKYQEDIDAKFNKTGYEIDGKYPNYNAVIPKEYEILATINTFKLYKFCDILIKNKLINQVTNQILFKYDDFIIGVNAKLIRDILKAMLMLNHTKLDLLFLQPHNAIVIVPPGNARKVGLDIDTDMALLMPILSNYDYNNWIYDLKNNCLENTGLEKLGCVNIDDDSSAEVNDPQVEIEENKKIEAKNTRERVKQQKEQEKQEKETAKKLTEIEQQQQETAKKQQKQIQLKEAISSLELLLTLVSETEKDQVQKEINELEGKTLNLKKAMWLKDYGKVEDWDDDKAISVNMDEVTTEELPNNLKSHWYKDKRIVFKPKQTEKNDWKVKIFNIEGNEINQFEIPNQTEKAAMQIAKKDSRIKDADDWAILPKFEQGGEIPEYRHNIPQNVYGYLFTKQPKLTQSYATVIKHKTGAYSIVNNDGIEIKVSNSNDNSPQYFTWKWINENFDKLDPISENKKGILIYKNGGEIMNNNVELIFYPTTKKHAKQYNIKAEKPLYLKNLVVKKENRRKGLGKEALNHINEYALKNKHDVIFGYITQKAEYTKNPTEDIYLNNNDLIKAWLHKNGYAVNEETNDFHKVV